ncbi:response regulator [Kinneretia asaccharophila]|uniref:Hpt domain-containing protein n=1 Tax=Roseateles asaccharophilus TaxID=582607 RepID=A0A4R6NA24_9BURK|nr:response regulator [Roseateles asaccharophilus]MDN3545025.1 response regulator [Roseateles asaccharophilus]TDP12589.1 Hpt domain-containing protein [Roseateles asaccharophilus]
MSAGGRPRVLLVEDDPSLQRFVQLALEEFEIELLTVGSVDAGLAELARAPVALVLTDLMLPERSGFELIDALAAEPALRAGARVAVFSAGLTPATRGRLERPEVWRLLSKPCGLAELDACVRDALAQGPEVADKVVHSSSVATSAEPPPGPEVRQAAAIAEYFGGNAPLYLSFRASCLQQFQADLAEGDKALTDGDAPALRRLAHSLKSVLRSLGHPEAASDALTLEEASQRNDWPALTALWPQLRDALKQLR